MADKVEVLSKYFGYSAFREGQEALIDSVLSGRAVLGVMPTGAGKAMKFPVSEKPKRKNTAMPFCP